MERKIGRGMQKFEVFFFEENRLINYKVNFHVLKISFKHIGFSFGTYSSSWNSISWQPFV